MSDLESTNFSVCIWESLRSTICDISVLVSLNNSCYLSSFEFMSLFFVWIPTINICFNSQQLISSDWPITSFPPLLFLKFPTTNTSIIMGDLIKNNYIYMTKFKRYLYYFMIYVSFLTWPGCTKWNKNNIYFHKNFTKKKKLFKLRFLKDSKRWKER